MSKFKSKLALGSANFGLDYGLNNKNGKLDRDELSKILNLAYASGIKYIDTAQAYGDSEQRLGACQISRFQVVTKIGVGLDASFTNNKINSLVIESLDRLSLERLSAVLLHRTELLLGPNGTKIAAGLNDLKERGIVEKIGVSIYSPDILDEVTKLLDLDIVQVPFNLFDQRILKSGWCHRLKDNGTEIHTRSIFLQGLLLSTWPNLPAYFLKNWRDLFREWFDFQRKSGLSADKLALNFGLQQSWIDKIVVGIDSARQLHRLLEIEAGERINSLTGFDVDDVDLIDPSRWRMR